MAPGFGEFTRACHCYANDPGKARGPDTLFFFVCFCLSFYRPIQENSNIKDTGQGKKLLIYIKSPKGAYYSC